MRYKTIPIVFIFPRNPVLGIQTDIKYNFSILAKKTLLESILFFDFDHFLSKKNFKCISDPNLVEFTSNLCVF
jgi:hypothetical protein